MSTAIANPIIPENLPRWRKVGNEIHATTIDEILKQGNLDWTVSKRPISTISDQPEFAKEFDINPIQMHVNGTKQDRILKNAVRKWLKEPTNMQLQEEVRISLANTRDRLIPSTTEYAIVRNDTNRFLTTVGQVYTPLANKQCIYVLNELMLNHGAVVERAGSFNYGAGCWVIARLPDSLTIGKETIDQFLKIGWSHDGTEKLTIRFMYVSTKHGLIFSPKVNDEKVEISIRHTRTGPQRVMEAEQIIASQRSHADSIQSVANQMVSTTCDNLRDYVKILFPKCDDVKTDKHGFDHPTKDGIIVDQLEEDFANQDSNISGSLWGAFIAVTDYAENKRSVHVHGKSKGISKKESETLANESHVHSVMKSNGTTSKMIQKIWDSLTAKF